MGSSADFGGYLFDTYYMAQFSEYRVGVNNLIWAILHYLTQLPRDQLMGPHSLDRRTGLGIQLLLSESG